MPAGALRYRVSLQQRDPSATPNAYNEASNVWVDVLANIPAQVYALSGREYTAAQQVQAALTHRVVIRTPTTLTVRPEYRFTWSERLLSGDAMVHYLDIKQVVPLATKRGFTECLCTEHLSG